MTPIFESSSASIPIEAFSVKNLQQCQSLFAYSPKDDPSKVNHENEARTVLLYRNDCQKFFCFLSTKRLIQFQELI